MKKHTITLAAVLLLSALFTGVIAEESDFLGTWYLTGFEAEGIFVSPSSMGADVTMIFEESGIVHLRSVLMDDVGEDTGVWEASNGQVAVTDSTDYVMVFDVIDGQLVVEEDGMKMIFSKDELELEAFKAPPVLTSVALRDFDGLWIGDSTEIDGIIIPLTIMGLEAELRIENGYVEFSATISSPGFGDDVMSIQGNLDGHAIVLDNGTYQMYITLHEGSLLAMEEPEGRMWFTYGGQAE